MNPYNLLAINGLELDVFLGWPDEERLQKQKVWLDVKMRFAAALKACVSDDLNDTVCYQHLIHDLREHLIDKKFKLVEHLTHEIYRFIETNVPKDTAIFVTLTKQPQITGLGNVTYHYGSPL